MQKIGLIAGNGTLPFLFLNKAKEKGYRVYTLAIEREAEPRVLSLSEKSLLLPVGKLSTGTDFFAENGIKEAVMLGQVRHIRLLREKNLDPSMARLLDRIPDKRTGTVLKAIADYFENQDVKLLPSSFLLENLFLPPKTIMGPILSEAEEKDVALGRKVAETLSSLDVGLTVAVKDGVVLALEAIEGTDLTISRAGRFTRGMVVVKVSRPNQDVRFDLPVVGSRTIRTLARFSGRVLAVSNGTFVLEKELVLEMCQRYRITLCIFQTRAYHKEETILPGRDTETP